MFQDNADYNSKTTSEENKKRGDLDVDQKKSLGTELIKLYNEIIKNAQKSRENFPVVINRENQKSRDNLLCYLILRKYNLENLQMNLAEEGLSSLGRLEAYVINGIEQVLKHFPIFLANHLSSSSNSNLNLNSGSLERVTYKEAQSILAKRSILLLGRPREGRKTRIMVTLDTEAAHQPQIIEELLKHGMDIARINCAHDTKREWKMTIDAIRNAEERLTQRGQDVKRKCRIVMDLAGPKIRTGPMPLEVRPLRIAVPKDVHNKPIRMVEGFFDSEAPFTEKISLAGVAPSFVISISKGHQILSTLNVGERLSLIDSRGRSREVVILGRISSTRIRIGIEKTICLQEGIKLHRQKKLASSKHLPNSPIYDTKTVDAGLLESTHSVTNNTTEGCESSIMLDNNYRRDDKDRDIDSIIVGCVRPQPIDVEVTSGDKLILLKTVNNGHAKVKIPESMIKISCTLPEVLDKVQQGHRIFIDDGKIEAIVISSNEAYLLLKIVSPSSTTAKIKAEKGLNFPDSELSLPAITSEDIENLNFIVNHATAVAPSFVHSPTDIQDLYKALEKIDHADFGIIAKIETRNAIHNLSKILMSGLNLPKFGVLIARGDLAVEIGFENLSLVQEDILCLCEAAHIPVILATQILETLAKSGVPTRAEITDAAMGYRAECVMLNKGKHVLEAVKILSFLLGGEEKHHIKKRQILRDLTTQYGFS